MTTRSRGIAPPLHQAFDPEKEIVGPVLAQAQIFTKKVRQFPTLLAIKILMFSQPIGIRMQEIEQIPLNEMKTRVHSLLRKFLFHPEVKS
jgi:hypothetical protein